MDQTYQDRQNEFGSAYEDFEPAEVVQLVVKTGEWLELLLMQPDAVNEAMMLLSSKIFGKEYHNVEATWREIWRSTSINNSMELKSSQFLVGLNAFAFFGLMPDMPDTMQLSDEDDGLAIVKACVSQGRALLDAIPQGWGDMSELRRTVLAAEARLRLDTSLDVSPEQLAALARISLKSIKNLLTPKTGGSDLRLNAAGGIDPINAAQWLSGRADFRSSLWRNAQGRPASLEAPVLEDVGEVLFVPVAKDGSWFDPVACRQSRGYLIGPKGSEEVVTDYRVALGRLSRMRTPYWRRPGPNAGWGLVAGYTWQRKIVRELAIREEDV